MLEVILVDTPGRMSTGTLVVSGACQRARCSSSTDLSTGELCDSWDAQLVGAPGDVCTLRLELPDGETATKHAVLLEEEHCGEVWAEPVRFE